MASIFQPSISDPTVPRDFSNATRGTVPDVSSAVSTALQGASANRARGADAKNAAFLGELAGDVAAVNTERQEAALIAQNLQGNAANVNRAFADGTIDESEAELLKTLDSQFTKFQQARTAGALNDNAFNIRKGALTSAALERAPHLTDDILKITGHEAKGAPTVENTAQQAVAQKLDNTFGSGNWGLKEMSREFAKQTRLANAKQDAEAGTLSVSALSANIGQIMVDATDSAIIGLGKEVEASGFVSPEGMASYLATLDETARAMTASMNKGFAEAQARGEIITPAHRASLQKQITDRRAGLAAFVEDKAFLEVSTRWAETKDAYIQANFPITALMEGMGGGGASQKLELLNAVLDPNSQLYKMMTIGDTDSLGPQIQQQMHSWVQAVVMGVDFPGPEYAKFKAAATATMVAQQAPEPIQEDYLQTLIKQGAETPVDIEDQIAQLGNRRIADNLNLTDPAVKKAFVDNFTITATRVVDGLLQEQRDLRFSPQGLITGRVSTRQQGRGGSVTFKGTNSPFARAWNDMLTVSSLPQYSSVINIDKLISDARSQVSAAQKATPEVLPEQSLSERAQLIEELGAANPNLSFSELTQLVDSAGEDTAIVQELLNDSELQEAGITEADIRAAMQDG